MSITLDGTNGITTPAVSSTGASTFTGSLALPSGGLTVGTNQLAVDSSGRVTMPYQPSFRAGFSSSGDQSTTTATIIPFDAESFDVGGNYNTATYRFTAPIAGRYLFHVNLYLTQSAGAFAGGVGFRVNGADVATTASDGARSDTNIGSSTGQVTIMSLNNTMILNLNANDYVQIYGVNYAGGASVVRYYKGTSFWQGALIG